MRVDDLNRRVDNVVKELSEIKADLRELKTRDEIIQDIVKRVQKLDFNFLIRV